MVAASSILFFSTPAHARPEAELLVLCREQLDIEAAESTVREFYRTLNIDPPSAVSDELEAFVPQIDKLQKAIGCAVATTLAGLLAKARVVLAIAGPDGPHAGDDGYVAWSLARDLSWSEDRMLRDIKQMLMSVGFETEDQWFASVMRLMDRAPAQWRDRFLSVLSARVANG